MNTTLPPSQPRRRGNSCGRGTLAGWPLRSVLFLVLTALSAPAQQTVTLRPDLPRIVVGAIFTNANTYLVPIVVTIAGGMDPVEVTVSGAPAGATAILNATLTNTVTTNLAVTITNVAEGVHPLTITATLNAVPAATATVDLVAGHLWTAAVLATANWSTATNWTTGTPPTAGSNVKLEDSGVVTNVVETSVAVDSLTYARFSSGGTHTTTIAPNQTLSVTGAGGFSANVESVVGNNKTTTINISGASGALVVSNENANFSVNALNAGNNGTTLVLSNLATLQAVVNRFGLGDVTLVQQGAAGPQLVVVRLARTNLIRAGFVGDYTGLETVNSITFLNNSERFNNGSANTIELGKANVFQADSLAIAKTAVGSGNNIVRFGPAFTAAPRPTASFRSANGGRMSLVTIGVPSGTQNVQANSRATLDLRNGTTDLMAETLVLGANRSNFVFTGSGTPNTFGQGVIVFNDGTIDVNTAKLGWQRFTNDAYARGTIAVGGAGVLVVNDVAELGHTSGGDPLSGDVYIAQTIGELVATNGGTIRLNRATVGAASTNNNITLSAGGLVIVSNNVAADDRRLSVLNMANSALALHVVPNNTNVFVNALLTSGLQNLIHLVSVTGITLPAQVPLISYQASPAAPNFSMGNLPSGMYGVVVNNAANQTIDAILSTTPPKTLVWRGDKSDNWNHSELNWVLAGTTTETNFADGDFVIFDDTLAGGGNVNISAQVVPGQSPAQAGVTVSNFNYTFSAGGGAILGTARLLKTGAGSLTLNANSENSMQVSQGLLLGSGNAGAVSLASGTAMSFTGNINGGLTCAGSATNGGSIVGAIVIQTGGVFQNNSSTLGGLTLQSGIYLLNLGTMTSVGSVVVTNSMLFNAGTIDGTRVDVNTNGVVMGTGTFAVTDRVQVNSGGRLVPGSSIGNMTMGGTLGRLDLFPGSRTVIEVDLAHPDTNDVIINGSLNFGANNALSGGSIVVTNVGATPFSAGQTFKVFRGLFSTDLLHNNVSFPVVVPPPGPGLAWDTSSVRTNGLIRVSTPPTLTTTVSPTNLTFRWPSNYISWRLEVMTNSVGIQTNASNWFTVAGSVSVSNTVIQTLNRTNQPTFYRLKYP